jgi:hypothetical protein
VKASDLAADYAARLLKIPAAAKQFGMSASTFLRFRNRHGIRTLRSDQVHVDDVINALERERTLREQISCPHYSFATPSQTILIPVPCGGQRTATPTYIWLGHPSVFSMKLSLWFVFLAASLLFLAGCANVDITKTSSGFYDRTDPNTIEVLKTRPEKSYEELGTITVTEFASSDTAKMHNAIRAKAAALGANAVVLTEEGLVPKGFGNYDRWATGVAIRFKTGAK